MRLVRIWIAFNYGKREDNMRIKEKIYINDKGIKYINGKRVATENPTPATMDFDKAVRYIDRTFNKYGLFTKCDRLVGLFKRGYDRLKVEREILRKIDVIPNVALRTQMQEAYLRKIDRVAR